MALTLHAVKDGKVHPARNGCHDKFGDAGRGFFSGVAPMELVPGVDQAAYSCSTTEASASGTVVYHKGNAWPQAEPDHGREKIRIPFIDFLGVGAT